MYSRARDLNDKHNTKGRLFLDQLWQECAPFVDANAARHAMEDLPSVFWELYLALALRQSGITIVRLNRTKKAQRGPDLLAENPDVWIKAVTPGPGTGGKRATCAT
jgi:hypothetical protein